ncbi:hypothetical protein [Sphingobacterium siyangense]|uniref:hypothetical protein n=1 Tax=Sphingobacterium siyangense TaxID=459529 RepID=UPI002FDE37F4
MKSIITTLFTLFILQSVVIAQKTRVYDGDGLNIKFEHGDSDKVYDIMFTGKDASGKLVWKKTQLIDITDTKYEEKPGYQYQVKDDNNTLYNLIFNTSMHRIKVDKLDKAGKRISTWLLYERKERPANNNLVKMSYGGGLSLSFYYNKKTEMLSDVQSYYNTANGSPAGYKTLKIIENEGGIGGENYCSALYGNNEYLIVYKPNNMNTIEVTLFPDKTKKTKKEFSLKLKTN